MQKKILIGPNIFFKSIRGYYKKGYDILILTPKPSKFGKFIKESYLDINKYTYVFKDKEDIIQYCINNCQELSIALLVPEVIEYLKLSIEDIKLLKPYLPKGKQYEYYSIILDYYIDNNEFTLTDKQRERALEVYLEKRDSTYKVAKKK